MSKNKKSLNKKASYLRCFFVGVTGIEPVPQD